MIRKIVLGIFGVLIVFVCIVLILFITDSLDADKKLYSRKCDNLSLTLRAHFYNQGPLDFGGSEEVRLELSANDEWISLTTLTKFFYYDRVTGGWDEQPDPYRNIDSENQFRYINFSPHSVPGKYIDTYGHEIVGHPWNIYINPKKFTHEEFQKIGTCLREDNEAFNNALSRAHEFATDKLPRYARLFYVQPRYLNSLIYSEPPPYHGIQFACSDRSVISVSDSRVALPGHAYGNEWYPQDDIGDIYNGSPLSGLAFSEVPNQHLCVNDEGVSFPEFIQLQQKLRN